jgi:hypothetical protein
MMTPISILVEGNLDETVAREIIDASGGTVGTVYGRRGVDYIEKKVTGFNRLAKGIPILTLVDLMDLDSNCPAEVVREWLPHRHEQMLLRLVVREIESWILADRTNISRFLGLRKALIPHYPEQLEDPKATLVELADSSQRQGLRSAIVPDDPTMNDEGPAYTIRMQRFVRNQWSVRDAMENAPSLHRCVQAVQRVVDSPDW